MDRHEIILFWSDEDNAFVADVPKLPGCMDHGDTHEAALAADKEAVALWVETAQETDQANSSHVARGCCSLDRLDLVAAASCIALAPSMAIP